MLKRLCSALVLLILTLGGSRAEAHPVPFSYVDLRMQEGRLEGSLVVHLFDVAHELGVDPVTRLLEPVFLATQADAMARLLSSRLLIAVDGRQVMAAWSAPDILPDRDSIRFGLAFGEVGQPGSIAVDAVLFPYDSEHRTFLNVYEAGDLASQEILSADRPRFEFFSGTRQGVVAVIRKFVPSGVHHILIGPDHLLFLVGLLLTGGSFRRLLLVVTAFTAAHSLTLTLAALGILVPPPAIIEPAIALSIVYVGLDNLLKRDGRDMRTWIAFAFGFIHGFGFANVLRDMDLPGRALGWSLFSFNIGVEIGQVAVVLVVAAIVTALRSRSEVAGRRLALAGSLVVIAAGATWFVQRTFFPGGS